MIHNFFRGITHFVFKGAQFHNPVARDEKFNFIKYNLLWYSGKAV